MVRGYVEGERPIQGDMAGQPSGIRSTMAMQQFGSCSVLLRPFPEALPKASRTLVEALSKDWDSAISLAEKRAAEEARAEERAKAEKLLAMERLKVAKAEQTKAEEEKIQSAKSLKALGTLTNEQIAESLKLPIEVVEKL